MQELGVLRKLVWKVTSVLCGSCLKKAGVYMNQLMKAKVYFLSLAQQVLNLVDSFVVLLNQRCALSFFSLYTICQCGILLVYLKFDEVHVHQKSIVADN